jgi:serralysin
MRKALRQLGFEPFAPLRDHDGDILRGAAVDPVAVTAPNGKPIFTIEQVISQLTRSGLAWNGVGSNPVPNAGPGTITYAFFDFAAQVYSSEHDSFQPLTAAQRDAARQAFALWGEIIDVRFVEGTVNTADINLGNLATTEDYFSAYASQPGFTRQSGDIWFSLNAATNQEVGLAQVGFRTMLHEIGHALGLSHPSNYNATKGVTLTYEANAQYFQDSLQYSIMSYFASSSTGAVRTSFAATPMAHDIAAMQSLYGPNLTTRTGDTVYGFNSNAGLAAYDFNQNTSPVVAIWDAGGRDTLDFSGWSSASRIDLEPGASSDGGGQTTNVQIGYGAWIENAVGGAGNDVISGNSANNLLQGGGGDDVLNGLAGTDQAEGGAGADIFVFSDTGHSMDYLVRSDGKKWTPDLLADFTSGVDKIDLSAIDAIAGTGADDAFTFIGTTAFSSQAGQLRFDAANGMVHILGDVDGNGLADLHIVVIGSQVLPGDFIL